MAQNFGGLGGFGGFQVEPEDFLNAIQTGVQNLQFNAMNTNNQMAGLAHQFGMYMADAGRRDAARDANRGGGGDGGEAGFRGLKPKKEMTKVNAEDARKLMTELAQFEVDLGEVGISTRSEAAYRQLRAIVYGKARDVLDLETVQGAGAALKSALEDAVANNAPRANRDGLGGQLYLHCIAALEHAVRLTPEKRMSISEQVYAEARMLGNSPDDAELFLTKWRRARFLMFRENLIPPTAEERFAQLVGVGMDHNAARQFVQSDIIRDQRELTVFLNNRLCKEVWEYIKERWDTPQRPQNTNQAVILVEKWIEARSYNKETMFDRQQKGNHGSDHGVRALLVDDGYGQMSAAGTGFPAGYGSVSTTGTGFPAGSTYEPSCADDTINAFTQTRNAGYMGSSGQGQQKPGYKAGSSQRPPATGSGFPAGTARTAPPGTPQCPVCKGHHPDLRTCPNGLAKQDAGFSTGGTSKCRWMVGNKYPCDGTDHFARHHRQQWVVENPNQPLPSGNKGKGK